LASLTTAQRELRRMVLNAVTSPHTRRNYSECGSDSPRDFTIQAAFP